MANAKIDENFQGIQLATADNALQTTQPLLVEPILDYLEIDLVIDTTLVSVSADSKIDENFEGVALAYDDTALEAKPLKVDATTGRLMLDLTFI